MTQKTTQTTVSSTTEKPKKKAKKQLTIQIGFPVNSGFQEMAQTIAKDPENYQMEDSQFDLTKKSGIYSQACAIGLQWMIDHPNQLPPDNESNLFAQKVAQCLKPMLDSRIKTLFEATIANYINNKSTNFYVKNILLALSQQMGGDILNVSINKLCSQINRNVDYILDQEKKQLMSIQPSYKKSATDNKKKDISDFIKKTTSSKMTSKPIFSNKSKTTPIQQEEDDVDDDDE